MAKASEGRPLKPAVIVKLNQRTHIKIILAELGIPSQISLFLSHPTFPLSYKKEWRNF